MYGPKSEQGWGNPYEIRGIEPLILPKTNGLTNRLSKDGKTLLAWVNQRTIHIDMRTDSKLNQVTTIAKEAFYPLRMDLLLLSFLTM